MPLPVTSSKVNVSGFEPVFEDRLHCFFEDPRITGKAAILSGCRSTARQRQLYDGWVRRLPGFNLAANPDRIFGGGKWRGSWHMQQPDGFCYAVDLRRKKNLLLQWKISWEELTSVASEYGLRATVPGEAWHFQHRNSSSIFPSRKVPEDGVRPWPRRPPGRPLLKKRLSVTNRRNSVDHVKWLQSQILFLRADGVFGKRSQRKVMDLQSIWGLTPDGIVGPATWDLLDSLGKPRRPKG